MKPSKQAYCCTKLASPGMTRTLSRATREDGVQLLSISIERDGHAAGGVSIRRRDVHHIAAALAGADAGGRGVAGVVQLQSGAAIEIRYSPDEVWLTMILPDGRRAKPTRLRGDELSAVRRILDDMLSTREVA